MKDVYDEEFEEMAKDALMDLGLPEDEADMQLEDFLAGY